MSTVPLEGVVFDRLVARVSKKPVRVSGSYEALDASGGCKLPVLVAFERRDTGSHLEGASPEEAEAGKLIDAYLASSGRQLRYFAPCGRCEVCRRADVARFRRDTEFEIELALAAGLPVFFVTTTLGGQDRLDYHSERRERIEKAYAVALDPPKRTAKAVARAARLSLPLGHPEGDAERALLEAESDEAWFWRRAHVPFENNLRMKRSEEKMARKRKANRGEGSRFAFRRGFVMEYQADGTPHGHQVVIGTGPGPKFNGDEVAAAYKAGLIHVRRIDANLRVQGTRFTAAQYIAKYMVKTGVKPRKSAHWGEFSPDASPDLVGRLAERATVLRERSLEGVETEKAAWQKERRRHLAALASHVERAIAGKLVSREEERSRRKSAYTPSGERARRIGLAAKRLHGDPPPLEALEVDYWRDVEKDPVHPRDAVSLLDGRFAKPKGERRKVLRRVKPNAPEKGLRPEAEAFSLQAVVDDDCPF